MIRRALAPAVVLALIALAAACSDSLGALCPAGTQQAGIYTTSLVFQNDPNACLYASTPDGGFDSSLAAYGPDGGADIFSAAICGGPPVGDAGPQVYFATTNEAWSNSLGSGGTFLFGTNTLNNPVTGTVCGCDMTVVETISGTFFGADGGANVTIDGDGGLSFIGGFGGTVVDQISEYDAGATDAGNCSCNLPCDLQYQLTGTLYQQ